MTIPIKTYSSIHPNVSSSSIHGEIAEGLQQIAEHISTTAITCLHIILQGADESLEIDIRAYSGTLLAHRISNLADAYMRHSQGHTVDKLCDLPEQWLPPGADENVLHNFQEDFQIIEHH